MLRSLSRSRHRFAVSGIPRVKRKCPSPTLVRRPMLGDALSAISVQLCAIGALQEPGSRTPCRPGGTPSVRTHSQPRRSHSPRRTTCFPPCFLYRSVVQLVCWMVLSRTRSRRDMASTCFCSCRTSTVLSTLISVPRARRAVWLALSSRSR